MQVSSSTCSKNSALLICYFPLLKQANSFSVPVLNIANQRNLWNECVRVCRDAANENVCVCELIPIRCLRPVSFDIEFKDKDGNPKVTFLSFSNYFELNSMRMNINTFLAFRIMEVTRACRGSHESRRSHSRAWTRQVPGWLAVACATWREAGLLGEHKWFRKDGFAFE